MRLAFAMLGLLTVATASASEPESPSVADATGVSPKATNPVHEATALLSRYAPGQVPIEPATIYAIGVLGDHGTQGEISLLRNLAQNERHEIRDAAVEAIRRMRGRQVTDQRESFARSLPNWPELNAVAHPLRKTRGYGREEARCIAYAELILGDRPVVEPEPADGDPWELLSIGNPRRAIAAARTMESAEARLVEARGREEIGDLRGALQEYAYLAANGNGDARSSIEGFGVDAERLLLGVLAAPEPPLNRNEDEILDVLVRSGGDLTVSVFSERARRDDAQGSSAIGALGRMLDGLLREDPLPASSRRTARRALVLASRGDGSLADTAKNTLQALNTKP